MDSNEILSHVVNKYSSCTSYFDAGTIVRSDRSTFTEFKTYFVAPKKFRLEWSVRKSHEDIGCNYAIGGNGNDFFWFEDELKPIDDIERQLNGPGALQSYGLSLLLLPLLLHTTSYTSQLLKLSDVRIKSWSQSRDTVTLTGSASMTDDVEFTVCSRSFRLLSVREKFLVTASQIRRDNSWYRHHVPLTIDTILFHISLLPFLPQKDRQYSLETVFSSAQFGLALDEFMFGYSQ